MMERMPVAAGPLSIEGAPAAAGPLPVGAWYDEEAGSFVCDFVELLPFSDGSGPFRLQGWQRQVVSEM